jgi:hypothetical protein
MLLANLVGRSVFPWGWKRVGGLCVLFKSIPDMYRSWEPLEWIFIARHCVVKMRL